jgi:serine-type D-Ala-D-Ala carboxypeptidase (penicillin-binding protein 5/6)
MPLPVLERVERRRVRYWRRRAAAATLIGLLAVGGTLAWQLRSEERPATAAGSTARSPTTTASAPTTTVEVTPAGPTQGPALLVRQGALASHAFSPPLGALGAILVDGTTGTVLWGRNAHGRLPIASTTKIMTAVLTLEYLRLDQEVVIRRGIRLVEPFREGLRPGERVPVRKLLYGLLLFSGNDDAIALGQEVGGTNRGFVRLMNTKARELGLEDTRFSNSSGVVDEGNWSSAWDLAALTRHALEKPRFRAIVATRTKRVTWPAPTYAKVYVNKNHLLTTYRGADGVKTGWTTEANHCLVASARRHGIHLIAVVLGSPNAYRDARRVLDFGFRIRG